MNGRPIGAWIGCSVAVHAITGGGLWYLVDQWHPREVSGLSVSAISVSLVRSVDTSTPPPVASQAAPARFAPREATQAVARQEGPPSVKSRPDDDADPASQPSELPSPPTPEVGAVVIDRVESSADAQGVHSSQRRAAIAHSSDQSRAASTVPHDGDVPSEYRAVILAILDRAKRYPLLAQHRGLEGTVGVLFTINEDGRLSDPNLVTSSRHRVLDDAALDILRRVGTVPPPPDLKRVAFSARIRYQMDQ